MKIFDKRCGWMVEGTYIETLPSQLAVPDDQMRAYFGTEPGHRHHEEHATAVLYDRIVLQKTSGEFIIVPVNPDCYAVE